MSVGFDPYYKWLGIPPKDQPPHHYRLLGVELFETDDEVIDAAANRLMAYLQGLSSGEHVEQSEKLLGQIAAVRLCLLDPKRKATYDQQLRKQLATAAGASGKSTRPKKAKALPRAVPMGEAVPVAPMPVLPSAGAVAAPQMAGPQVMVDTGQAASGGSSAARRGASRARRPQSANMMVIPGVLIVLVLILGLGLFLAFNDPGLSSSAQANKENKKASPRASQTNSPKTNRWHKNQPAQPQLPPSAPQGNPFGATQPSVPSQTPEVLDGQGFPVDDTSNVPIRSFPSLPNVPEPVSDTAEELLLKSRQALQQGNMAEMIESLEQLSAMPDLSPEVSELVDQTLEQARSAALTHEEAVQLLLDLSEDDWQLALQDLTAVFPGSAFTFKPMAVQFRATLARALPEAARRRDGSPTPGGAPPSGLLPDGKLPSNPLDSSGIFK